MHRDAVAALRGRGLVRNGHRLPDGTLFCEEPRFDILTGRVDTVWDWSGPSGSGQKAASMRIYTATELAAVLREVGLTVIGAYKGCSNEPFQAEGADIAGRLGLVAQKPGQDGA